MFMHRRSAGRRRSFAENIGPKKAGNNVDMVKAGFQAGDIVIALEGYRVETLTQYEAINECFRERPEMKLTMWRGSNFERKITVAGREIDLELRSYPITGY